MTAPSLDDVAEYVASLETDDGTVVVGIAGAVAAGKTTVARDLGDALSRSGLTSTVLGTDAFLYPNAILTARGLDMRKGFPESFDHDALVATIGRARDGEWPLDVPVYSHDVYDVLPERHQRIDRADTLIVEGVTALQEPVRSALDMAVYVDADEADVRRWFTDRLIGLVAAAAEDASSFYRGFVGMPDDQVRALADGVWSSINGPNLLEHIAPSGTSADVVIRKRSDHSIATIRFGASDMPDTP